MRTCSTESGNNKLEQKKKKNAQSATLRQDSRGKREERERQTDRELTKDSNQSPIQSMQTFDQATW